MKTGEFQTENGEGHKPCEIDGAWVETEDIREEMYVILGERPREDIVKIYTGEHKGTIVPQKAS